jgi:tetratricopeptide (TPR) repeat protein
MRQFLFLSLLFAGAAGLSPAQKQSAPEGRHNRCELWGQVVSSDRHAADGMEIELAGNKQAPRQRTHIVNGTFEFQPVPEGTYQFRLFDRSGQVIVRRTQSLDRSNNDVILRLPYDLTEPSSNVISLAQLSHKAPRQALDAFHAGLKAVDAGELEKSVADFQKAISIDSQYAEAENNLAALYSEMGRIDEALPHAERAFEISPGWVETGHTLAMLLILTRRYEQSEALARAMLANQQAVSEMHAVLAISLIGQRRSFEEAFGHLGLAIEGFPMARLLAANTLIEIGLPILAAVQVNDYVQFSAHECERAALERWAAKLDPSAFEAAANTH